MAHHWTFGAVRCAHQDGNFCYLPGWTNGLFGIDWRPGAENAPEPMAYVLTHLATGWSICAITADLTEVIRAASEIEAAIDWTSADPGEIKVILRDAEGDMRALIKRLGGHNPGLYYGPPGLPDCAEIKRGQPVPGTPAEREAFYDSQIAPVLADLSQQCFAHGLSFLAIVEWEKGEIGRTVGLQADRGPQIAGANRVAQLGDRPFAAFAMVREGGHA